MSDNFIKSKKSELEPVTITGNTFTEGAPINNSAEPPEAVIPDVVSAQHLSSVFQAEIERQAGELEKMRSLYREKDGVYQRTLADFDNFRRRVVLEKDALIKIANEKLIKELLPTIDSYDRSLHLNVPPEAQDFKLGMELIYKNLMSVLAANGVEAIDSDGAKFDPNLHEAVSHADSDLPEETITSTYQKGYTLGGKVIRHAIVVVSNGKGAPSAAEPEAEIPETTTPEIDIETEGGTNLSEAIEQAVSAVSEAPANPEHNEL